ncbi:MAG: ROK family protein [Acidobacteria bacterium]|nr:ROK family protein [Acidobacteriota bacterium]
METYVGIDIGKTNLRVAAGGLAPGSAVYFKRTYERGSPEQMDHQVYQAVDDILAKGETPKPSLASIGICMPAVVSRTSGHIVWGPDFDFLRGHSLTKALEERYGVPVAVDVDSRAASWGEVWAGIGRTCGRFALVTWGTGLGAGMIVDGKPYEGPNNLFAEFGHSVVSDDDWPCSCGAAGCLNALVTGPAIAEHGRRAVMAGRDSIIKDLCDNRPEAVTSPMIFTAAERGDAVALAILGRIGLLLGRLASNLVLTFQPEKIVLVGGLAERAHWVLRTINETMRKQNWLIFKGQTECEVVASALGDTAGVLGAIRMAQEKWLRAGRGHSS